MTMTEFLASIGYTLDERSADEFERAIRDVNRLAERVAMAMNQLSQKVGEFWDKTYARMTAIGYASARMDTSAENLQAVVYGLQGAGLSASQASQALNRFSMALQMNPSVESVVRLAGVKTKQNGQMRDTSQLFVEFVTALQPESGKNYTIAASMAGQAGISETNFAAISRNLPQVKALIDEQHARLARFHVDGNQSASVSVQLYRVWLRFQLQISAFFESVALRFTPAMTALVEAVDQWVVAHRDDIVRFVNAVISAVLGVIDDLKPLVPALGDFAARMLELGKIIPADRLIGDAFVGMVVARVLIANRGIVAMIAALMAAFSLKEMIAPSQPSQGGVAQEPATERQTSGWMATIKRAATGAMNTVRRAVGLPETKSGDAATVGPAGGDPGTGELPHDRSTFATSYGPKSAGDNMEGGLEASRRGLDGQALVRTLEDYRQGNSKYVTIAGNPAYYGNKYTIPEVTYHVGDQTFTLKNVPVYLHDTGSAFKTAPEGRFDVPIGKDLNYRDTNQGLPGVRFKPGWAAPQDPAPLIQRMGPPADKSEWADPTFRKTSLMSPRSGVNVIRETNIVVHGDADPHRTVAAVNQATRRVHFDMVKAATENLG